MTVFQTIQGMLTPLGLGRLPLGLPLFSTSLPVLLAAIIIAWVNLDMATDQAVNPEVGLLQTCGHLPPLSYDFIVVGAGSAGMIVATRIANNSKGYTVLLLEAGGEPAPVNNIPSMDFFLLNETGNTWMYESEKQTIASQDCDNQQTFTTRGKMLGGSSSSNFMMYVRGNAEDYNRWVNDTNDQSWSYQNMLPYFKKSENYVGYWANLSSTSTYHGSGGLLNVGTFDYQPGCDEFLAAGAEKGYTVGDYNGANQAVFSPIDITTRNGWRESTYRSFYVETGKSSNLVIKKYALVSKINFNSNNRAVSVTYKRQGCTRTVTANKEIIVSAGVFNSPQILMLSGVGPATDLQALNIPVVLNLPVGQNLQDHCYTFVGPFPKNGSLNPDRDITAQAAASFLVDGSGPVGAPAGLAGQAFFQSPYAVPAYPDLQVVQFSVSLYNEIPRDINNMFGLNETLVTQWWQNYFGQDARTLVLWLGRPKSVGYLKLRSTNINDVPIINPQYLSHPDDIEALLYGFKIVVDLYQNSSALNASMINTPVPGCESFFTNIVYTSAGFTSQTDDYYRCVIQHVSGSLYHHVGTCAMGQVVDNNLNVMGATGLRVIDASVIPRTPNGNTNAPTIVVAEKGADIIMNTYNMY